MVSIIMPTYNRFEIVKETISKINAITTSIPFELIVVNDGNDLPFVLQLSNVSFYKNPKKGVSAARNFGVSKAKYELLFFIDDDMWVTAESLAAIEQLHQSAFFEKNCVMLNWQYPTVLIQQMQQEKIGRYLLKSNYHTLEGRLRQTAESNELLMPIKSIGSGSFVIHKKCFEQVGKYDEAILFQGEDIDMSNKVNAHKIGIYLYTKITCFHNQKDRLDINGFLDRIQRGWESQFKITKQKQLAMPTNSIKKAIFTALIPMYFIFQKLFTLLPNQKYFDIIIFRLIGILSSVTYYKTLRDVYQKN